MNRSTQLFFRFLACGLLFLAQQGLAAWQAANVGGGGWFERIAVAADGTLYVASDLSGVYVSTDNGQHWAILGPGTGMDSTHVAGFGMHPNNPARFFVGTEQGIYKTTDAGVSFL